VAPLAIKVRTANNGELAAVLSAEGPAVSRGFVMPFGGTSGARGQHYHQILDISTSQFLEGAVRVPFVSEGGLEACWAPDDRFVLYYSYKWIVIVPVEAR
jgi:hypothetical protein